jgi:hypothetical protein
MKVKNPTAPAVKHQSAPNYYAAANAGQSSDGCRAALVLGRLSPRLISSSPGTAGLPPFISFWTGYPKRNVRLWHKADVPEHSIDVRFWG